MAPARRACAATRTVRGSTCLCPWRACASSDTRAGRPEAGRGDSAPAAVVRQSACAAARASGARASACPLRDPGDAACASAVPCGEAVPGRLRQTARAERESASLPRRRRTHRPGSGNEVHVEVERAAKSLHEGDGTRPRRSRSSLPGAPAQEAEDRAQREIERARDELRVPGEKEACSSRERQHPLAHGHAAGRVQKRSPACDAWCRKGRNRGPCRKSDQHLIGAGGAAHAGGAVREDAASEVPLNSEVTNPGRPAPSPRYSISTRNVFR